MSFEYENLENLNIQLIDGDRGKNYPKQSEFQESGYCLFLSAKNVTKSGFQFSEKVYVSEERHNLLRAGKLERYDIVLTTRGTIGNVAFYDNSVLDDVVRVNSGMLILRANTTVWNPRFLYFLFTSKIIQEQISSLTSGSAVPQLPAKDLRKFLLPKVPMGVQNYIVKVIGDLSDKLKINDQTNQTLEEMAQAIFKSWFVDFDPVKAKMNGEQPEGMDAATASLFPEKLVDTDVGDLPDGWKLVPVGELLDKTIGGDWGKEEPDEKHTEEVRIVRGTDIPKLHGGAIESVPVRYVESKKLKTRKLERGDIVIEVSGGSKDQPTGRSLFISDNILKRLELPSEPASFCRRFTPKSYEIGLLLAVHFQLMYQAGKTWEYQNQSTGISNFQTKYFLEAEHIVIPSDDVLDAFVKQVSPMMDMIHSNQNIELAKLRDTLLPKLLSGEIELGETEEMAEVN
ncbi:restriction endonuclease subunit S [Vibrio parahaemolyticus]|nr:restriction endonuclease subunit S [Vibrio parahaemolyticus]HCE3031591.1 restriction endonuclease subunit S [Vibrio parahaemolyticus]HCE4626657.1 restriction endonuclease subunit S [Vibrio parahaemolyticus]